MVMINERDMEIKSGSSIYWVRDTEKIFEPNKIKKPKGKSMLSLSVKTY